MSHALRALESMPRGRNPLHTGHLLVVERMLAKAPAQLFIVGSGRDEQSESDGENPADMADLAEAHDKAEDEAQAPVFPLEACGDLQWFPEFASLFGDN